MQRNKRRIVIGIASLLVIAGSVAVIGWVGLSQTRLGP